MDRTTSHPPHPIVFWEVTRLCEIGCRSCGKRSDTKPSDELTTYEAYKVVDEIAALQPRRFVITGGDPLERADLVQVIDYARRRGLDPALTLPASRRLRPATFERLQRAGLTRVIVSFDGATSEGHDEPRGVQGLFRDTLHLIGNALTFGMAVEVNTAVRRTNLDDLPEVAARIERLGLAAWNLYFPVPLPQSMAIEDLLRPDEVERVFGFLRRLRIANQFEIRVYEAPHELRYRIEAAHDAKLLASQAGEWADFTGYEAADIVSLHDAPREIVFVTHDGQVWPSELLPLSAGNVRYRPLARIYAESGTFTSLRDPSNLKGKCARCEYKAICGGSRARAYAMTGDPFAPDSLCAYQPAAGA